LSLESFAWLEICKPSKLSSADGGKTLEICGGKNGFKEMSKGICPTGLTGSTG
jgi:hypothetical protein